MPDFEIDLSGLITAADKVAAAKAAAKDAIANRRWQAMGAGMTFEGHSYHTDDTAQTRILGAAVQAMLDPLYQLDWKTADGAFVTLDAAQTLALAQAIRAYVQACYTREAYLLAALEAGDSYDLEAGWPS